MAAHARTPLDDAAALAARRAAPARCIADSRQRRRRRRASSPGPATRDRRPRSYVARRARRTAPPPAWSSRGRRRPSASTATRIAALRRPEGGDRPDRQPLTSASRRAALRRASPSPAPTARPRRAWWTGAGAVALGQPRGVIGTLRRRRARCGIGAPPSVDVDRPTPRPTRCCCSASFRRFADAGLGACAIEASSIGIVERRLDGTRIARRACSPTSRSDHLDYHGTWTPTGRPRRELFALARPARRGDQRRRRAGRARWRDRSPAAALDVWTVLDRGSRRALRAARHRLRRRAASRFDGASKAPSAVAVRDAR